MVGDSSVDNDKLRRISFEVMQRTQQAQKRAFSAVMQQGRTVATQQTRDTRTARHKQASGPQLVQAAIASGVRPRGRTRPGRRGMLENGEALSEAEQISAHFAEARGITDGLIEDGHRTPFGSELDQHNDLMKRNAVFSLVYCVMQQKMLQFRREYSLLSLVIKNRFGSIRAVLKNMR